ncbi:MAG: DNA polymerase III subunit tau [Candidatus Dichloromethanomonas elyunquensis]|nr:MAG: DNA polymerase III subunit tau [Candidatus Dichloromethanomonas elyunquensis]
MAYLALYREWRPKNFRDIVGQEHVRVTLTNALLRGKVAHAYLFSGPRGTGKTTAAKILAKALNCNSRDGAEPCNECSSCRDIDQGLALDVLEIDAASNRGIDEIRDLREKVKLAASSGKYKVYIIDEVHMLTTEAFNALLKTLEEPPASVVFVLATTEVHKVPLTILSRVQRFEFHRISSAGITNRLQEVCAALGRQVEEKALQIISVKAEGGLRDALSILDQCLLQDDPIRVEHVYQAIGMVGETFSADLTEALLEGDYGLVLSKLEEGVALGRDPRQIVRELLDYLRQALLFLAGGQEPLLSPDVAERLNHQSKRAGLSKILTWINVLLKGEGELRYTSNGRLAAEMIFVQTLYEQDKVVCDEDQKIPAISKKPPKSSESKKETAEESQPANSAHLKKAEPIEVGQADFSVLLAKWPEVLEEVKRKKKSTHAFLLEGRPAGVIGETLYLVFKDGYSFHRDKFNQPENRTVVESVLEDLFGRRININNLTEKEYMDLHQAKNDTQVAIKGLTDQETRGITESEEDCIQKAVEFFGAELVHISKDR